MANDGRRAFPEDMFADDQEKWSWPGGSASGKAATAASNYNSEIKSDSSSSEDGEGFMLQSDSNSFKQDLKKQVSLSGQEETSSSSQPADNAVRERSLPSIYDDDAQSGKPSSDYKKDDLAFPSSLRKSIGSEGHEPSPSSSKDKDTSSGHGSSGSTRRKDSKDDRRDRRSHRSRSRSPSHSKNSRNDQRRRSKSRDRYREKKHRSHSRDNRRRSRSYDRHRRGRRNDSRDRYRRKHSRSKSRSRERSRGGGITPQMALQQTMAQMSAKAQALTGIALPKYYNPAAVNPLKYAEQVQKRKLLWQKEEKPTEQQVQPQAQAAQPFVPSKNVWNKLTFAQDQDGKMTAKFRKLMGIKTDTPVEPPQPEEESAFKKQEELFRDLDQQYEMARMTTHTQRGVGLGYSHSQPLYPPVQK